MWRTFKTHLLCWCSVRSCSAISFQRCLWLCDGWNRCRRKGWAEASQRASMLVFPSACSSVRIAYSVIYQPPKECVCYLCTEFAGLEKNRMWCKKHNAQCCAAQYWETNSHTPETDITGSSHWTLFSAYIHSHWKACLSKATNSPLWWIHLKGKGQYLGGGSIVL